jgi:hypothetical protein
MMGSWVPLNLSSIFVHIEYRFIQSLLNSSLQSLFRDNVTIARDGSLSTILFLETLQEQSVAAN